MGKPSPFWVLVASLTATLALAQSIKQFPVQGTTGTATGFVAGGDVGGPKADEQLPPTAAFSCTPLQADDPPLEVTCTDASTGVITSWAWDFGDGGTSTTQNPVHEFETDETQYTVTLVVTNGGGSDSEVKVDYVDISSPAAIPEPVFYFNLSSSAPTYLKAPLTFDSFSSYYGNETFGVAGKVGTAVSAAGNGATSSSAYGYRDILEWSLSNGAAVNREHTCNVWTLTHDGVDTLSWDSLASWLAGIGTILAHPELVSTTTNATTSGVVQSNSWSNSNAMGYFDAPGASPAAWHMVTWAQYADGGNNMARLWVDGVQVAPSISVPQASLDQSVATTGAQLALGGTQKFDEFACWNVLFSQANVDALFNGGAGVALPYP